MKKGILLILGMLSLLACDNQDERLKNADPFYTEKSDFDLIRFPLIKPYEALSISDDTGWYVQNQEDSTASAVSIPGAKHINVIDSVVIIHAQKTLIEGQQINEGWFVLVPKIKVYKEFKSRQEFMKYVLSLQIKNIKMYSMNEAFQCFYNRDTLDWKQLNRSHQ
ncbi:hypothetical protein GCM10023149_49500 [Mucilaginibacter gynuensis]|uniref:Uncharacterized protein n=1 Tax=Mucilaginibacter gynuensis TaxID=1302236 RepID=A0ABP8HGH9_9SPHI